ncbi:MAG: hypothetical protein ACJZ47_01025 [bacterium]
MSDISETFTKGNLHDLVELLIAPTRCGFFLTRNRIREIGSEMGLRTGIQTRKRMLENLFREAGSENKIFELLEVLDSDAKFWSEQYSSFSKKCRISRGSWENWTKNLRELRSYLSKSQKWSEEK